MGILDKLFGGKKDAGHTEFSRSQRKDAASKLKKIGLDPKLVNDGQVLAKTFLERDKDKPFWSPMDLAYVLPAFVIVGPTASAAGRKLWELLRAISHTGNWLSFRTIDAQVLRRVGGWQDPEPSALACDHCSRNIPRVAGQIDAYAITNELTANTNSGAVRRLYCLPCYFEYEVTCSGNTPSCLEAHKQAKKYIETLKK